MLSRVAKRMDPLGPALLGVIALALFASGTALRDAIAIPSLVTFQVLVGLSLWRLATWRHETTWVEGLGAGVVLGVALTAVASQVTRLLQLPQFAWLPTLALLPLVVAVGMRLWPPKYRLSRTAPRTVALIIAALTAMFVIFQPWFKTNPMHDEGWRTLFVDVPFFESLGWSLVTLGPSDNNMVAGVPVRYHWLTYAWTGTMQVTSASEPFVVISRVAPLVLGVAVLMLGYAWIIRITQSFLAAAFALILLLTANDVGTGFGRVLFPESPSLISGAAFVLLGTLVATIYTERPPASPRSWLGMFLVVGGIAAAGTAVKVAVGLVLIGGGALATLAMWRDARRSTMLCWTAAATLGSVLGFLLTASGTSGRPFTVSPGGLALKYDFMGLGLAVGIMASVIAIAAPWAGLTILGTYRHWRNRPELWLAAGGAAAALLVAVVVELGGGDQLQLPVVATAIAAPLSAAGVAMATSDVKGIRPRIVASAGSVALGMAAAVASQVLPSALRWAAPISVVLAATVAGFLFAGRATWLGEPSQARRWVAVSASVVVLASIGSGLVVTAYKYEQAWTSAPVTAESQLSWDEGDIAAARWVAENAPKSDIIASSRWCKQPVELTASPCSSYWWLTSALTGRQVLVEGSGYWISSEPREAVVPMREESVRAFLESPSQKSASALADQGVRWVWVDKRNTTLPTDLPYAPIAYENERVQILRLEPSLR